MFNHTSLYALKACAMIASMPPSTRVLAKDLARESHIPPQYLSKILHKLARSGVLSSRKGIGGGFFLERSPSEVKLQEVVGPFQKKNDMANAVDQIFDLDAPSGATCAFQRYWGDAVRHYNDLLENTTLADVSCPMNTDKPEAVAPAASNGLHVVGASGTNGAAATVTAAAEA